MTKSAPEISITESDGRIASMTLDGIRLHFMNNGGSISRIYGREEPETIGSFRIFFNPKPSFQPSKKESNGKNKAVLSFTLSGRDLSDTELLHFGHLVEALCGNMIDSGLAVECGGAYRIDPDAVDFMDANASAEEMTKSFLANNYILPFIFSEARFHGRFWQLFGIGITNDGNRILVEKSRMQALLNEGTLLRLYEESNVKGHPAPGIGCGCDTILTINAPMDLRIWDHDDFHGVIYAPDNGWNNGGSPVRDESDEEKNIKTLRIKIANDSLIETLLAASDPKNDNDPLIRLPLVISHEPVTVFFYQGTAFDKWLNESHVAFHPQQEMSRIKNVVFVRKPYGNE